MIDIHSHVLAGIDDGPDTLEGSLDLVAAAEVDGVQTLAATPHLREDHPRVSPSDLSWRCSALNEGIVARGSRVRIVSGAEVSVTWAATADSSELHMATYGQRGTDLLLETPSFALSPVFEDVTFKLAVQGIRVVLAHPERCATFQRSPERLGELVRRGMLLQVNASSLLNDRRRSRSRRLAGALVEEGLAHVIASDSHTAATWRPPSLSAAVEAAARINRRRARWMVTEAPEAILVGEPLPAAPSRPGAVRRFLEKRR